MTWDGLLWVMTCDGLLWVISFSVSDVAADVTSLFCYHIKHDKQRQASHSWQYKAGFQSKYNLQCQNQELECLPDHTSTPHHTSCGERRKKLFTYCNATSAFRLGESYTLKVKSNYIHKITATCSLDQD